MDEISTVEMTDAQVERFEEFTNDILDMECLVSVCLGCGSTTEAPDYVSARNYTIWYDFSCCGTTVLPHK